MGGRPITLTIQNDTGENLTRQSYNLTHGAWTTEPAKSIAAGSSDTFTADSRYASLTGPQGVVTWQSVISMEAFSVTFNHPNGTGKTTLTPVADGNPFTYSIENDQLQHEDASATVDFSLVSPDANLRVRPNQNTLTSAQRTAFVNAVLKLKANGIYDQFVQLHMFTLQQSPPDWAHETPAFLPWHREFLNQFELQLQTQDASVTLPYWEWDVDNTSSNNIFGDDFMGPASTTGPDGPITTGPFNAKAWILSYNTYIANGSSKPANFLQRWLGNSVYTTLPTTAQIEATTALATYDVAPFESDPQEVSFRNVLEGWAVTGDQSIWSPDTGSPARHMHNRVHFWVGGSMTTSGTAPNDPLFFLHHAYLDKIWYNWQINNPNAGYQPQGTGPLPALGIDAYLTPWDGVAYPFRNSIADIAPLNLLVTPRDVLNPSDLGYKYV